MREKQGERRLRDERDYNGTAEQVVRINKSLFVASGCKNNPESVTA